MFLLHKDDGSAISSHNDPNDPTYNPIYKEAQYDLDSTDPSPPVGIPARAILSLPAGFKCDNVKVGFEGTTASSWELTLSDPSIVENPAWIQEASFALGSGGTRNIWTRSKTFFGEVPTDDRSVAIRVTGAVERVI